MPLRIKNVVEGIFKIKRSESSLIPTLISYNYFINVYSMDRIPLLQRFHHSHHVYSNQHIVVLMVLPRMISAAFSASIKTGA